MTINTEVQGTPNASTDATFTAVSDENTSIAPHTTSVQALADIVVTLPNTHQVGQKHAIDASGGSITLITADGTPILNGTLFPQGTRGEVEFCFLTAPNFPGGTFAWISLGAGGGGLGTGEILVPKIIDVHNLVDTSLPNHIYARPVDSVDQPFELVKDSTALADGITIVNALSTGAGPSGPAALPGRWLRNETSSKRWSLLYLSVANGGLGGVFIDPFGGDDENLGAPDVAGARLKTLAEACRRLHQAQAGRNYQFVIHDTSPTLDGVPATDRWRPSFVLESNMEDVNPATGIEQTFNATLIGSDASQRVYVTLSTMTGAGYVKTAAGVQARVTDAGLGNAGITTNLGKMMIIISDPVTPANNGSWAFIGTGPAQDPALAANTMRVSQFVRPDTTEATAMAAGTTYKIVDPVRFAPSMLQFENFGRYVTRNLLFTPVATPPSDQMNFSIRLTSIVSFQCKWQRNYDMSITASAVTGCAFTDAAGDGSSLTQGLWTENIFTANALINCLVLNVNMQHVNGSHVQLNNSYLEKSQFQTAAPTPFVSYGAVAVPSGARGAFVVVAGAGGLGIYNWPATAAAAFRIHSGGRAKVNGNIHGGSSNPAQVCVLSEAGASEIKIADGLTPTIGTGAGGSGVGSDTLSVDQVNIANPPAGGKVAAYQSPSPLVAGVVTVTAASFRLWADWTNAATFNRQAFNPASGGRIVTIAPA